LAVCGDFVTKIYLATEGVGKPRGSIAAKGLLRVRAIALRNNLVSQSLFVSDMFSLNYKQIQM
jgi:hypothetical protein